MCRFGSNENKKAQIEFERRIYKMSNIHNVTVALLMFGCQWELLNKPLKENQSMFYFNVLALLFCT